MRYDTTSKDIERLPIDHYIFKKFFKNTGSFYGDLKNNIILLHKKHHGRDSYITNKEIDFVIDILESFHYKKNQPRLNLKFSKATIEEKIDIYNQLLGLTLYNGAKIIKKENIFDNDYIVKSNSIINEKIDLLRKSNQSYLSNDIDKFSSIKKNRLPDLLKILTEIVQDDLNIDEKRKEISIDECLDLTNEYKKTRDDSEKIEILEKIHIYNKNLDKNMKKWVYETIFRFR